MPDPQRRPRVIGRTPQEEAKETPEEEGVEPRDAESTCIIPKCTMRA